MASETLTTKKRQSKNGSSLQRKAAPAYRTSENWPLDIEAAYRRDPGPYTAASVWVLLDEEPLELFNGWLVWQEMTNLEERRIANIIQVILDLAARWVGFGQAYPDQAECEMQNGAVFKPDVCVISNKRYDLQAKPVAEGLDHIVLKGSPELVVEIRSPSNRRTQERRKRLTYFENGAEVIWDVDPIKPKIWVYEVEKPEVGREFSEQDEITCERLLLNWKRMVSDFFAKDLSAEDIAGQAAVEWRSESHAEGKAEGREEGRAVGREEGELTALRKILLLQAQIRYGETALPAGLEARLGLYNSAQLTGLAATIATSPTLEEWLASFSE